MKNNIPEYIECLLRKTEDTTDAIIDGTSLAQRFYFPEENIIGKKAIVIPISVLREISVILEEVK